MRILLSITLLCAGITLVNPTPVRAQMYSETSTGYNTHDLPGNAEVVPYNASASIVSLTTLDGTISYNTGTGLTEGDVYKIYISNPAAFSASTPVGGPNVNGFDTQLFLFNLNGTGIESNDNDPNGTGGSSTLAANPNAAFGIGYYYLEITGSSLYPAVSTNGTAIFSDVDPTATYGPTSSSAVFAGYTGSSTEGGQYSISLTGVVMTAPEPSNLAWMAAGAACGGLAFLRRKVSRPCA